MRPQPPAGFPLTELLLIAAVLILLGVFFGNGTLAGPSKNADAILMLSNMRQLHRATEQMALDGLTLKQTNLAWPGNLDGSFATWAANLVTNGYLEANDLDKLLSAKGRTTPLGTIPGANTNAVLVYAVRANSPATAVFLTSANFTNTPTGGMAPLSNSIPFGNSRFVVFHKGGDGTVLPARQAGDTNAIGSFVPLLK